MVMFRNFLPIQNPIRRLPLRGGFVPMVYRRPVQCGGFGNDIFYNNNGGAGPPGPTGPSGPPGPTGPSGTIGLVPVTLVAVSPYVALLTDYDLAVTANATGPASVVLPVSPVGTVFIVKDAAGVALTNSITISAIGVTIDGVVNTVINANYGSLTFIFNGTEWNIV